MITSFPSDAPRFRDDPLFIRLLASFEVDLPFVTSAGSPLIYFHWPRVSLTSRTAADNLFWARADLTRQMDNSGNE
jgi:hypothetical protein